MNKLNKIDELIQFEGIQQKDLYDDFTDAFNENNENKYRQLYVDMLKKGQTLNNLRLLRHNIIQQHQNIASMDSNPNPESVPVLKNLMKSPNPNITDEAYTRMYLTDKFKGRIL
jgi:hypothetical protein